jgi:hypothetical protein
MYMDERIKEYKTNCTYGIHWEFRKVHKNLVGIPQEKRPYTKAFEQMGRLCEGRH